MILVQIVKLASGQRLTASRAPLLKDFMTLPKINVSKIVELENSEMILILTNRFASLAKQNVSLVLILLLNVMRAEMSPTLT